MTAVELLCGAVEESKPEVTGPAEMRVTCYTWTGNKTYSGNYPEEGICASSIENIGNIAVVYDKDMNFIGSYICADTGSAERLVSGESIDIYFDSKDKCYEFIEKYGDYQNVVFVKKKGD